MAAMSASMLDLGGGEPVLELAAIEHELQRADADAERGEAEQVERATLLRSVSGSVGDDADGREDAERHVHEEHPAPAVVLGEPAAEQRPDDGAEHHAHAPDRHRAPVAFFRIDVEQDRLRQRQQRRAADALQRAEQHDLRERFRPCRTARRRR